MCSTLWPYNHTGNYIHTYTTYFNTNTTINFANFANIIVMISSEPVSVAARSQAFVCGRSLAAMVVSSPAGGIDVSLL
jgi:hypothetical protein